MVCLAFYIKNYKKDTSFIVKNSSKIETSEVEGQEIIRRIDEIALHGSKLVNESNVSIISKKNTELYIEIVTDQLDASDRTAKLGIYGKQPTLSWEYSFEDWVLDVLDRVKEFSVKVDRSIKPDQLRVIRLGLKSIYYKQKRRTLFLLILKIVLGFIIPILVGLLLQIFPVFDLQETLLPSFFVSIYNIFLILLTQKKI